MNRKETEMARQSNPQTPPTYPIVPPQRRTTQQYRFRESILLVPMVCVLGVWLFTSVDSGWQWMRFLKGAGVIHSYWFSAITILAVGLVGLLAIVKVLRDE